MIPCLGVPVTAPVPTSTATGPWASSVGVLATPYATPAPDGQSRGRFLWGFDAGAELAQDRDEFSSVNPFMRFVGDTSWRGKDTAAPFQDLEVRGPFDDVHSRFDLTLSTIGAQVTEGTEEFLTAKKAVTFGFALESRMLVFSQVEGHTLFLGPLLRGGFQTLIEAPADNEEIDSVSNFYGAGFRLGESKSWRTVDSDQPFNQPVFRYVDVYYGRYENHDRPRWTFDAQFRPDPDSGLFLGASAIVGSGKDDVRLYAGFSLDAARISGLVSSLGSPAQ